MLSHLRQGYWPGGLETADTTAILPLPERRLVVARRVGATLIALERSGLLWRNDRVFLDGVRRLRVEGDWIIGEAWEPEDRWRPFAVNLLTGKKRRRWFWSW